MGRVDEDDEEAFRDVIGAITSTSWADAPPRMSKAAWRMLSDDGPLFGDNLPNLDVDDGSTQWNISLEALTADFGDGRTAIIAVPAFGSFLPITLTLLEHGNMVHKPSRRTHSTQWSVLMTRLLPGAGF